MKNCQMTVDPLKATHYGVKVMYRQTLTPALLCLKTPVSPDAPLHLFLPSLCLSNPALSLSGQVWDESQLKSFAPRGDKSSNDHIISDK